MNDTDVAYTTRLPRKTGYIPDDGWQRNQIRKSLGFAPEADCEASPDRRELVVYTVVWRERDGRPEVLVGQRQPDAGKDRLHGDYFLGWGGHVERRDVPPDGDEYVDDLFLCAVARELNEELAFFVWSPSDSTATYHGLLNDPSDDVGRDHLGLAYSVQVGDATVRESDKDGEGEWWQWPGDKWVSREREFESWSRLLLPHRGDMVGGDR